MRTNIHFLIISPSVLRRMGYVSEKSCKENHNTYFLFNIFFFFEYRVVNEINWKNIVKPDMSQRTI